MIGALVDFSFNRLRESDLPMLHQWLNQPHVAAWWGPAPAVDELRDDYFSRAAECSSTQAYIALCQSQPIGFVESYVVMGSGGGWWQEERDPGARGIDQFLAETSHLGKGFGSAMVRAFVEQLFTDPTVTVVQTETPTQ